MTTLAATLATITLPTIDALIEVLWSREGAEVIWVDLPGFTCGTAVLRREVVGEHPDFVRTEWRLAWSDEWDICPTHVASALRKASAQAQLDAVTEKI